MGVLTPDKLTTTKEEMVTITKTEYNSLLEDSKFLAALEKWGVDNWEGYGEARREIRSDE